MRCSSILTCTQEDSWCRGRKDGESKNRWIREASAAESIYVMDSLGAHLTDAMMEKLSRTMYILAVIIPGGCTSTLQPMDVSLNKLFKDTSRWLKDTALKARPTLHASTLETVDG